jgi:8-oxo-dGTP pyrophosphatase MutT (NUDIX family)
MVDVVTCILMDDAGKILILKRSDKVRTYKGLWSGISGYVEESKVPIETAIKEIKEEIGISESDVSLVKEMDSVSFVDFHEDKKYYWRIFPFLFKVEKKDKLIIDWEHSQYCWIFPSEINKFEAVPRLKEIVLGMFQ